MKLGVAPWWKGRGGALPDPIEPEVAFLGQVTITQSSPDGVIAEGNGDIIALTCVAGGPPDDLKLGGMSLDVIYSIELSLNRNFRVYRGQAVGTAVTSVMSHNNPTSVFFWEVKGFKLPDPLVVGSALENANNTNPVNVTVDVNGVAFFCSRRYEGLSGVNVDWSNGDAAGHAFTSGEVQANFSTAITQNGKIAGGFGLEFA